MTGPAVDQGNSMTMEEIEAGIAAPVAPPKLEEVKLEGDDVPEAFKGKSAAELVAHNKALETSLRLSESARIALERPQAPAPVAPVAEAPAPRITREQLQEIYEKDPLEAFAVMSDLAIQNAARHYEARMSNIELGSTGAAEAQAKAKYGTEFEVLGKEIEAVRRAVPDQSIFNSPKAWEDLVSYVRGQPENFDKIVDARAGKTTRTAEAARAEQEADIGFSATPVLRAAPPGRVKTLDATQKEIAATLGLTEAEYIKWHNLGDRS